jgi:D-cysteine desulfhydrase
VREPPRIELARAPTPIEPLDRLSALWKGPRIFVKRDDLTGSWLSGNKVRKLEYCLGDALRRGARTVITCGGLQSNHCRATALAAARLGLRCILHLRTTEHDPEPDGNLLLDRLAGAEIRFVTPERYRLLGPTDEGYWIPEGASNEIGVWGYVRASEELAGHRFDALFHAVGSGGTTAGLVAGKAIHRHGIPLAGVCVCDDAAFFHDKVDRILAAAGLPGGPSRAAVEILDGYVGRGYAQSRPEEWALLREVAALEGLLLDPVYTVKAFLGMREQIRLGRYGAGQEILFLHTGGTFGLFPRRGEAL